jgi:AcrR family transcriptional regulator
MLAERRSSWEAVRLHEVATELGITLDEVRRHFREKEEVVEAWFDRADGAMLACTQAPGFAALTARERLQTVIMAWLAALAPHRKVTRQMILGKFEPGHVHIQIPGLLRVSRTVQWMREAAQRDAAYLRRALEETALTTIYLTTFFVWMCDGSQGSDRTRRFLERSLGAAEQLDRRVYAGCAQAARRGAPPPATRAASEEPTL